MGKPVTIAPKAVSGPRIVTLDIETAPLESYHWGLWDQNIGLDMIKEEWSILSYSAKWLGEDKVYYNDTGGSGVKNVRNDKKLLQELWNILDEADIVVAQNGKAFDVKKINARLIMKGFSPYSPIRVIDTMLAAKKHFCFTSNKLAWMSEHLTTTPKSEHKKFPGFELWAECLKDNQEAWIEMKKYNCLDTIATEELYLKLRPWMSGHPNVAVYNKPESKKGVECNGILCPKCGGKQLKKRGFTYTQIGHKQLYQCKSCKGYSSGRLLENSKENRLAQLGN